MGKTARRPRQAHIEVEKEEEVVRTGDNNLMIKNYYEVLAPSERLDQEGRHRAARARVWDRSFACRKNVPRKEKHTLRGWQEEMKKSAFFKEREAPKKAKPPKNFSSKAESPQVKKQKAVRAEAARAPTPYAAGRKGMENSGH